MMQKELRELKLWRPAREIALKAGVRADQWDAARLDLATQRRIGLDDAGSIVVMENGQPASMSPDHFFKSVYSKLRPRYYTAPTAESIEADGGRGMSRADFDQMDAAAKSAFIKTGGRLFD